MHLLDLQDWTFPVPIAYGPGRLAEIGAICRQTGMSWPLIVTDRGSRALPFMGEIAGHLRAAGLASVEFSGISPNPRDTEIDAGREAFRTGKHDGIIGIGGGSAMDGAKAIALTARSGVALWDFEFERPAPAVGSEAFPPLILIPTTAGTGAETESTAMITDTAQGMKFCVWHGSLKPSCALLDPALTVGLPATLTAWTGLDALTHAIEAYSVPAFHPLCDGAAGARRSRSAPTPRASWRSNGSPPRRAASSTRSWRPEPVPPPRASACAVESSPLGADRYMHADMETAGRMLREGALVSAVEAAVGSLAS